MDIINEGVTLDKLAIAGAKEIWESCIDHPEQRRFWWGYDLENGGRVYMEYRRGRSVPEVGDTYIQHFSED